MPTALERVQVLCRPDLIADLKTLARHNRMSMSAFCGELMAHAIKSPKYREQLEEAAIRVPVKPDPRSRRPQAQFRDEAVKAVIDGVDLSESKLAKMMKILEMLED